MSEPTENELAPLRKLLRGEYVIDDEGFHVEFDEALESKLDALDPEWMRSMREFYVSSGARRWYA